MNFLCSNTHIFTWADFHPGGSADLFRNCRVNQEINPKDYMLCLTGPSPHPNGFETFPWLNPTRGRDLKAHKWPFQALPWRQASLLTTPCEECKRTVQDWTALPLLNVNYLLPSFFCTFCLLFSLSTPCFHFTKISRSYPNCLKLCSPHQKLKKETGFLSQITESSLYFQHIGE